MPFVLDASVTACWAFEDEDHPHATLAFDRLQTDPALAPVIWWIEVRNVLLVNERRKRFTEADSATFLRDLSQLAVVLDNSAESAEIFRLGRTYRLSAYDAAYLELAQRKTIALATLDSALIRAARSEHVPIIGEQY